jgi:hypothetical protein
MIFQALRLENLYDYVAESAEEAKKVCRYLLEHGTALLRA